MEAFKIKNGITAKRYLGSNGTTTASSEGYRLTSAAYDHNTFSFSSQFTDDGGLAFNSDGTKMYIVAFAAPDSVYQYSLSTAYHVSTASYDSVSFDVSGQAGTAVAVKFNPNGTKMYIGDYGTDTTYQYSLSTAFDISTASYDSVSFSTNSEDTLLRDIAFNNDGTAFYMIGTSTDSVYQYSLTTAYDISTASYDSVSFDVSAQIANPYSLVFNADGTKMFVAGSSLIQEYTLSTGFDLSTASVSAVSYTDSNVGTAVRGLGFNNDGSKLYWLTNSTVFQYSTVLITNALDLSTGHYFNSVLSDNTTIELSNPPASGVAYAAQIEITGTTGTIYDLGAAVYDNISFSVADQETFPSSVFFKPDGTKMYILGQLVDDITEYDLSTAWDITTSVFNQIFSVAAREATPTGLFFKPDGTKMYVVGQTGDDVNEYNLSTAWDISTASYVQIFSVYAQEINPSGIFFKPDGTKMYVCGTSGDEVNEYNLSTAWDISTSSFVQNFSVSAQDNTPRDVFFKSDGTVMYVLGDQGNDVNEYSLSTAWDISSAVYNQTFLIAGQETVPHGLFIKPDGTKMYLVGTSSDAVFQYSLTGDATITWPSSIKWEGGVVASPPEEGKTSSFAVFTIDGGITYYGSEIAKEIA